jgi:hypothetical protein
MYGPFVGSTTLFEEHNDANHTADAHKTTYDAFISQNQYSDALTFGNTFNTDVLDGMNYRRINNLFSGFMCKIENSKTSIRTVQSAALYKFNPDGSLDWTSPYGNLPYIEKDTGIEKCPAFQGIVNDIQVSSGDVFITGNVINIDTDKPSIYGDWSQYYNSVVCHRVSDKMLFGNGSNNGSGSMSDCLGYFDDNVKFKYRWFDTSEKINLRSQ